MAAPFRDLFVELPRAVFDSLQAIGEGAIAQAHQAARDAVAWLISAKSRRRSNCRSTSSS